MKKHLAVLFALGISAATMLSVSAEEYLFKLRDDAAALCEDEALLMTEECFIDDSSLARIGGVYTTDDISIIEKYQSLGMLEYYEENAPAYLFDMPNTSEYMTTLVYGYVPIGESYAQLNADEFWKLGLNGNGITVAVIDSGANVHTALSANLLSGYNTYDSNYTTSDGVGHGTMVSGFIAGNSTDYRGVAYGAKIIPIKAFNDSGSGNTGTMADGIYKAIEYGCDIINMSCGTLSDKETLKAAVKYAIDNGIIIVAASGNVRGVSYGTATEGTKDANMYPACYDGVISVGNIDINEKLSNSSMENDYVDVVAHGKYVSGLSHTNLSGYAGNSGTSFSCPIVSGIVACMLQADPVLTVGETEAILQQTAADLGAEGWDMSYGYGKVNCAAIVKKLLDGKLYRSDIVEYKNTYNIALRNGFGTAKKVSVTKTVGTDSTTERYDLTYGSNMCIQAPSDGILKLAYENGGGLGVYIRNATSEKYTSKLLNALYSGRRMTFLNGSTITVSDGMSAAYSIPLTTTKGTKLFLLDTSTLKTELLLDLS